VKDLFLIEIYFALYCEAVWNDFFWT